MEPIQTIVTIARARICKPFKEPQVIYSSTGYSRVRICEHFKKPRNRFPAYRPVRAGIFKKSMGARHRGGIHRLAESISGLLKRLQKRAQFFPRWEWNPKTTYKDGSAFAFYTSFIFRWGHGRRNYKDTNKTLNVIFIGVVFLDWRYSQSCCYFRPLLCELAAPL